MEFFSGQGFFFLILTLVGYGLGALVLYWIIRLAVRHGIADADERRGGHDGLR
ncbi:MULTISPECIES: hypothetical protein [unclassified Solwaraspora]|uniref:hypothetical protein n=1 Tax=unclassified Solwaraspora TaxID=2627926 RepID=UPI00259B73D3|nr:hypothetical protein [Solwaraspora sp. WMMA2056]WJK41474.1 hypothetical protein O7608_03300 [Solwaraspora sp. WMMA2056]